jgi:hypothetical protein
MPAMILRLASAVTKSLVRPEAVLVTRIVSCEGFAAADPPCKNTKAAATPASVAAATTGAPRLVTGLLGLA